MFNTKKIFGYKVLLALVPLTVFLGACAETHTQLQAGDNIAPLTRTEMQSMAKSVYLYNVDSSPTKLKVNSLHTIEAMMFLPGDEPDFLVCIEWEAEEINWTYQYTSPNYRMIQSYPKNPIPMGVRLVSKPGDPATRYGAYVARLKGGINWSPVLFKRQNEKLGSTLISTICR